MRRRKLSFKKEQPYPPLKNRIRKEVKTLTKELKEMTHLEKQIFMLLPSGIDNLISTKEIESILGIDKRHIMAIIETLILKYGIPIGSSRQPNHYGYFIATNEEEKRIGVYSLIQQINATKERVKRVKNADLNTAVLYKEKYRDEKINRNIQSNIYEYIDTADDLDTVKQGQEQAQA